MELRYVYRRIEDDIGAPVKYRGHPHDFILRKIRMSFRETRDLAEVQRSRLICTASMAASPDIDIGKAMPSVMRDMTENAHMMMPYFTMETNDEPADPNSDDYAECFKLLDEMEESESPEATHIST